MKKIVFTLLIFVLSLSAKGQEIGIRFGDVLGNDVAVDGIFSAGEFSRLHADVSFGSGVGIDLLWDFQVKPLGSDGLNWYLGFGPSMLIDDPFWLGVSGEIGLEYHFKDVPIALGIDWRPIFFIIEDTEFEAGGFGFNARYVFGK
jgi:hypothetical protein